ncbi:MAG: thioredoxin domain-containing protein, partial [Crocinitomicaceae bacterium]
MYQNALVNETSLYLKQHAHNPVEWHAWSPQVFEEAKKENKLVLVSIGYSACHWCHVMEKECFEDEEVAELMNKHFVCVKVDREERPDIDMVYMTAVQLMTQRGGWPLNCFTLPDGKPIYGGTYFPKDQWMHVLRSLVHTFQTEPQRVKEYADNLTDGITQSELINRPQELV